MGRGNTCEVMYVKEREEGGLWGVGGGGFMVTRAV